MAGVKETRTQMKTGTGVEGGTMGIERAEDEARTTLEGVSSREKDPGDELKAEDEEEIGRCETMVDQRGRVEHDIRRWCRLCLRGTGDEEDCRRKIAEGRTVTMGWKHAGAFWQRGGK